MAKQRKNSPSKQPAAVSFADHIGELRNRFALVVLVFVLTSALAYQVRDQLVEIVLAPIGQQKLIYLTPAGGFSFIFQITMYAGILATAPVAVYQMYRFVAPVLPSRSARTSISVALAATLLMVAGASFGYFVAIPAALHFLTTFAGDYVNASLTADSYLNFVVAYVIGLGLLFELPLLLLLWNIISPIKPGGLLTSQQYIIVGAFVAAAIITPTPDALNQAMVALPIIGIYQIGVVAVYVFNRGKRIAERRANSAAPSKTPILPPLSHHEIAPPHTDPRPSKPRTAVRPLVQDITPMRRQRNASSSSQNSRL